MLTTRHGQRRVRERTEEAQAAQGRLIARLDERLGTLETIQLARREAREGRALFRAGREGLTPPSPKPGPTRGCGGGVEIVTGLTAAAVLTLGALGVMREALTLGLAAGRAALAAREKGPREEEDRMCGGTGLPRG